MRSGHERDCSIRRKIFFRKGEEVASERQRSRVPVDKDAHKGVSDDETTKCAVITEMRETTNDGI